MGQEVAMKTIQIDLSSMDRVRQFVTTLSRLEGDFDLVSGYHILDAHSLMGIFGFDLSRPINLRIYQESEEVLDALRPFLAEGRTEP